MHIKQVVDELCMILVKHLTGNWVNPQQDTSSKLNLVREELTGRVREKDWKGLEHLLSSAHFNSLAQEIDTARKYAYSALYCIAEEFVDMLEPSSKELGIIPGPYPYSSINVQDFIGIGGQDSLSAEISGISSAELSGLSSSELSGLSSSELSGLSSAETHTPPGSIAGMHAPKNRGIIYEMEPIYRCECGEVVYSKLCISEDLLKTKKAYPEISSTSNKIICTNCSRPVTDSSSVLNIKRTLSQNKISIANTGLECMQIRVKSKEKILKKALQMLFLNHRSLGDFLALRFILAGNSGSYTNRGHGNNRGNDNNSDDTTSCHAFLEEVRKKDIGIYNPDSEDDYFSNPKGMLGRKNDPLLLKIEKAASIGIRKIVFPRRHLADTDPIGCLLDENGYLITEMHNAQHQFNAQHHMQVLFSDTLAELGKDIAEPMFYYNGSWHAESAHFYKSLHSTIYVPIEYLVKSPGDIACSIVRESQPIQLKNTKVSVYPVEIQIRTQSVHNHITHDSFLRTDIYRKTKEAELQENCIRIIGEESYAMLMRFIEELSKPAAQKPTQIFNYWQN